MKIYLDVCCLNRCFDDQRQPRIRLESEAVTLIFDRIDRGLDDWSISPIIDHEVRKTPDIERREKVLILLSRANHQIPWSEQFKQRGRELAELGFPAMDAFHIAAAEAGACDILLTTDEALLRRCNTANPPLRVTVDNPLRWVEEILKA